MILEGKEGQAQRNRKAVANNKIHSGVSVVAIHSMFLAVQKSC